MGDWLYYIKPSSASSPIYDSHKIWPIVILWEETRQERVLVLALANKFPGSLLKNPWVSCFLQPWSCCWSLWQTTACSRQKLRAWLGLMWDHQLAKTLNWSSLCGRLLLRVQLLLLRYDAIWKNSQGSPPCKNQEAQFWSSRIMPWSLKSFFSFFWNFWQRSKTWVLQMHVSLAGPNKMKVSWMTGSRTYNVPAIVRYGTAQGQLTQVATGTTKSYNYLLYQSGQMHHVILGPLADSTTYFYMCGGFGPVYNFTTPPPAGRDVPIKFAIVGKQETCKQLRISLFFW